MLHTAVVAGGGGEGCAMMCDVPIINILISIILYIYIFTPVRTGSNRFNWLWKFLGL